MLLLFLLLPPVQPLLWQLFFRLAFEQYHHMFALHIFLGEEDYLQCGLGSKLVECKEFHEGEMVSVPPALLFLSFFPLLMLP